MPQCHAQLVEARLVSLSSSKRAWQDGFDELSQRVRDYTDCYRPDLMKKLPWVPVRTIHREIGRNMQRTLYEPAPDAMSGGVVSLGNFPLAQLSAPGFTPKRLTPVPGFVGKLNVVTIFNEQETVTTFAAPERYNGDGQLDGELPSVAADRGAAARCRQHAAALHSRYSARCCLRMRSHRGLLCVQIGVSIKGRRSVESQATIIDIPP